MVNPNPIVPKQKNNGRFLPDPATKLRNNEIAHDFLRHMPLPEIMAKYGMSKRGVEMARDRGMVQWQSSLAQTADSAMMECDMVIEAAWKAYYEDHYVVGNNGKVVLDPVTDQPLRAPRDPEPLRIINQAIQRKCALAGWDAPKKRISVSYKLEEIKQQIREFAPMVIEAIEAADDQDE